MPAGKVSTEVRPVSVKHVQLEGFAELGGPAVVLGFGGELPLLVTEVRANDVNLHEGPENALCLPAKVIGCHNCQSHMDKESNTIKLILTLIQTEQI